MHFVLGNHDYYGGSFASVPPRVQATCRELEGLHWLRSGAVRLSPEVLLAGSDGWYDARNGHRNSGLQLNDFVRIEELRAAQARSRDALLAQCAARADEEAGLVRRQLEKVLTQPDARALSDVIVMTHVPPFQEAAWHQGRTSDDTWAPFFSSRAMGESLLQVAMLHADVRFSVLCGHTHGAGMYAARENLTVYTGAATYGAPELAGVVEATASGVTVRLTRVA